MRTITLFLLLLICWAAHATFWHEQSRTAIVGDDNKTTKNLVFLQDVINRWEKARDYFRRVNRKYRNGRKQVRPLACRNGMMNTLTKSSGVIQSMGFSRNGYPKNLVCNWKIVAPKDKAIKLTFNKFRLEPHVSCARDFLAVFKEEPAVDNLLDLLCGRKKIPPVTLQHNVVHLMFRSDKHVRDKGFKLTYTFVAKGETDGGDGPYACKNGKVKVEGTEGEFASPSYTPNTHYANRADCEYTITVPQGKTIKISFTNLVIEYSKDCRYDSLTLYDGTNMDAPILATLCGNGANEVRSSFNTVVGRFKSNSVITKAGFHASFEAVDPLQPPGPCGVSQIKPRYHRIVGGQLVIPNSWPWMVAVQAKPAEFGLYCGGAILSERYILTVAHCTYDYEGTKLKPNEMRVVVGEHNTEVQDPWQRTHAVESLIRHEYFRWPYHPNDLALIELKQPISLNPRAKPICLPHTTMPATSLCAITGWGSRFEHGSPVAQLNQAHVPIIPREKCNTWYKNRVSEKMLCAGYESGGKDSCAGDSGGPLMCEAPDLFDTFLLTGITSWGEGCGQPNKPGVYTNVFKYLDWIQKHTGLEPNNNPGGAK